MLIRDSLTWLKGERSYDTRWFGENDFQLGTNREQNNSYELKASVGIHISDSFYVLFCNASVLMMPFTMICNYREHRKQGSPPEK